MYRKDYSSRQKYQRNSTQSGHYQKQLDRSAYMSPVRQQKMRLAPIQSQEQNQQNSARHYIFNRNNSTPHKSLSTNVSYLSKISKKDLTSLDDNNKNRHFLRYRLKKNHRISTKDEQQQKIIYLKSTQNSDIDKIQSGNRIWQNKDLTDSIYKKLYKIATPKIKIDSYDPDSYHPQDRYLPIIDCVRFVNLRDINKKHSKGYLQLFNRNQGKYRKQIKYLHQFRKIAHAILFTIYLRKFNQKIRKSRDQYFSKFVYDNLKEKLFELKRSLIQCSRPFFMLIIDKFNFDYRPSIKDDIRLQKQKVNSLHKLVNYQINCVQKCLNEILNRDHLTQTIYFLCKHGNYSCLYSLNTIQELNSMCISERHGYMRADKYLEQSSIVSLVFIKLLLFNILLQPQKIGMQVMQISNNINRAIIYNNIKLAGNILYQLFIDVQDSLQEQSPQIYTVGNWVTLKNRFDFKFAASMTVKERYFTKNQPISGLENQKIIKQVYRTNQLVDLKRTILRLTNLIHQKICRYHEKMKKIIYNH